MKEKGIHTTKAFLLIVAEKQFLEKGFTQTTTIAIAKEAGCNQSLVHYYFRTKENLFQLVFGKLLHVVLVGFNYLLDETMPMNDRIRRCMYAQFEAFRKQPEVVLFLINELSLNPKSLSAVIEMATIGLLKLEYRFDALVKPTINSKNIHPISTSEFLLGILTMNMGTFSIYTTLQKLAFFSNEELLGFLDNKKEMNYEIFIKSFQLH